MHPLPKNVRIGTYLSTPTKVKILTLYYHGTIKYANPAHGSVPQIRQVCPDF
jgi:hypothetical protein